MSEEASSPVPAAAIRHVTEDDLPALARFIEPFVRNRILLPRTADELQELIPHGFVAESEGRLVGFAALEVYSSKLAEVRSLAVDPSFQGQGVGRLLVQQCVELARANGILEVMAITSSESFFRSCGFDFTLPGERKALFIHTRDDEH